MLAIQLSFDKSSIEESLLLLFSTTHCSL